MGSLMTHDLRLIRSAVLPDVEVGYRKLLFKGVTRPFVAQAWIIFVEPKLNSGNTTTLQQSS